MSSPKMVGEDASHYRIHDGKSEFKVPKAGLSDEMHAKIRALAPDGGVQHLATGGETGPAWQRLDAGTGEPEKTYEVTLPPEEAAPPADPAQAADFAGKVAAVGDALPPPPTLLPPNQPTEAPPEYMAQREARATAELQRRADERAKFANPRRESDLKPGGAPAPVPAAPMARTGGGGGVGLPSESGRGETKMALEEQQARLEERGNIEAYGARKEAAVLKEKGQALLDLAADDKAARSAAKLQTQEAMGRVQAARDEIAKIDTKVDPDRFWASRSTGGKIAGIIGLVLGSIGAAKDGVNRSVGLFNQAIDRDIDAQKAEHDAKMRKGQMGLEGAQSMYSMTRQAIGDDTAARDAAKATALGIVQNKLDQTAATVKDPLQRSNAMLASSQIAAQIGQLDQQASQNHFDNSVKRAQLGIEQQNANTAATVAGAKAGGVGMGQLDQKQRDLILSVETQHQLIQRSGQKLKDLIRAKGTQELTGPEQSQMKQLVNDIATAQAKMNDPNSAARPSEVEAEAANIFKPGFLQSSETAQKVIDSYMANSANRRGDYYRTVGIAPPGGR